MEYADPCPQEEIERNIFVQRSQHDVKIPIPDQLRAPAHQERFHWDPQRRILEIPAQERTKMVMAQN